MGQNDASYELVASGDCIGDELIETVEDCRDAINEIFGVQNANVLRLNSPYYAKGCFKYNYGHPGSEQARNAPTYWFLNSNGGPGTSGHCTEEPGYAACICRSEAVTGACFNAVSDYTPFASDPLAQTAVDDFNNAVGLDSTTSDGYYAWCNLYGCPQFNNEAESWCSGDGGSACGNQCEALPGGANPVNGRNGVCTRYGVPNCDSCYYLSGFNLETNTKPRFNLPLGSQISASYEYTGTYPIDAGIEYSITNVEYESECETVTLFGAPRCEVDVEIEFCEVSNCDNTLQAWFFTASGIGPDPYTYDTAALVSYNVGGDDIFLNYSVQGEIDSELDFMNLDLLNVAATICPRGVL